MEELCLHFWASIYEISILTQARWVSSFYSQCASKPILPKPRRANDVTYTAVTHQSDVTSTALNQSDAPSL